VAATTPPPKLRRFCTSPSLYESELRTQDQEAAPDTMLDHRTSEEATGE
jgi:hypothetical protein